ncbi:protein CUSTOS-like [Littorina saxatilis]
MKHVADEICSSSESESDSSDDEKLQRLKEAAVALDYASFAQSANAKSGSTSTHDAHSLQLPSQRAVEKDDHADENVLGTTPEFRAFISRKLSEKLDSTIEFCPEGTPKVEHMNWLDCNSVPEEGVPLFSASSRLVYDVPDVTPQPRQKRRKVSSSSSGSSEDERLASAAVTEDFLSKERRLLVGLGPSPLEKSVIQGEFVSASAKGTPNSGQKATKKKRKKKKKQKNTEDSLSSNTRKCVDSEINGVGGKSGQKATKKKKKKKQKNTEDSLSLNTRKCVDSEIAETTEVETVMKKRKKHKKTEEKCVTEKCTSNQTVDKMKEGTVMKKKHKKTEGNKCSTSEICTTDETLKTDDETDNKKKKRKKLEDN